MTTTTAIRGGAWLTEETDAASVLTPEKLSEEHRLIGRTAEEFVDNEVLPALDRLEQRTGRWRARLIERCGELGLLGTDVPEALGGVALDKAASLLVGEAVGRCASFATTFGAQTGLAVTPLLCFGSEAQKAKYLPRARVTGEMIGAYALSSRARDRTRSARRRAPCRSPTAASC